MTIAPWPSVDDSACRHCGAHVTDQFCRVFGDNSNRAHRCGECDSYRRLSRGTAAGEDVDCLVHAARRVLERDDLTRKQRREIAETLSTRAVTFDLETSLTVTRKGDE